MAALNNFKLDLSKNLLKMPKYLNVVKLLIPAQLNDMQINANSCKIKLLSVFLL